MANSPSSCLQSVLTNHKKCVFWLDLGDTSPISTINIILKSNHYPQWFQRETATKFISSASITFIMNNRVYSRNELEYDEHNKPKSYQLPIIPVDMLSQMLPALCGINQIHLCGNTCNCHMHPSLLCTSDEGLLARKRHNGWLVDPYQGISQD